MGAKTIGSLVWMADKFYFVQVTTITAKNLTSSYLSCEFQINVTNWFPSLTPKYLWNAVWGSYVSV